MDYLCAMKNERRNIGYALNDIRIEVDGILNGAVSYYIQNQAITGSPLMYNSLLGLDLLYRENEAVSHHETITQRITQ